jgi:type 1 glutamine amidotransferase
MSGSETSEVFLKPLYNSPGKVKGIRRICSFSEGGVCCKPLVADKLHAFLDKTKDPVMNEKRLLLLLGGNHHDFAGFAATMGPVFHNGGYQVEASYEPDKLLRLRQDQIDLVVMYTCLGGSRQGERIAEDLNPVQTEALANWVQDGGGLLAAHAATVIGEANPALRRLIGGNFISHPPQFSFTVYPLYREHPITQGINSFSVFDEFYIENYDEGVELHLAAFDRGVCHPMAWSKPEGQGRVAHISLGHGPAVWTLPPYQQLMRQAATWLVSVRSNHQ